MANDHKRRAASFRLGVLGTLAGSAALTVVAAQFSASWPPVAAIAAAVVTAMMVMLGIWFRAVKEPAERVAWTSARMTAEQVKAEVCKYLAGASPYRDRKAVALLTEQIDRLERDENMHEVASKTPSIHDLRSYVDNRVRDQITYHRATSRRLKRNLRRLQMAEYVFQGMAAALAAVGAVQARDHRTVSDLEELVRKLPSHPDPALVDTFVTSCEQIIARQNDDWLTQLTGKQSA